MSSKIFSYAERAFRQAEKYAEKSASAYSGDEREEMYTTIFNNEIRVAKIRFNQILELSEELHEQFLTKYNKQWLFITVRPDDSKITFHEFTALVNKFVHRKAIKKFTLSYEQKGTCDDDLGKGFHCHIVCDTNWRSKGEALRDTFSTFNKVCAQNCIQVDKTNNPESIIEKYLISYDSKDEHKSCTKQWDDLWRKKLSIQNVYNDENVEVTAPAYQVHVAGDNEEVNTSRYILRIS